jgi:ATP-dependent helicase HrpB
MGRRLARGRGPEEVDATLRRALLAGYPDRVARRREAGSSRLVLASGTGAVLARESGVRHGDLLVAVDVTGQRQGAEAIVRLASRIEREWLTPTRRAVVHRLDPSDGSIRAFEQSWYDDLLLEERSVAPDPGEAAPLLAEAVLRRGLGAASEAFVRRAAFAGVSLDVPGLVLEACRGRTTLPDFDLSTLVPRKTLAAVDRDAPRRLDLPSGRQATLQYRENGTVVASVKLQELFGLGESPKVGRGRTPVVFELLAPSGRPVQTTSDLGSFWTRGYPEVRRELRGRYPRHPWPEDPWTASPTHRTKRRR